MTKSVLLRHLRDGSIIEEYNGTSLGVKRECRNYIYYKMAKDNEMILSAGFDKPVIDLSSLNFSGKWYWPPEQLHGTQFIIHVNGIREKELKLIPDDLNIVSLI